MSYTRMFYFAQGGKMIFNDSYTFVYSFEDIITIILQVSICVSLCLWGWENDNIWDLRYTECREEAYEPPTNCSICKSLSTTEL